MPTKPRPARLTLKALDAKIEIVRAESRGSFEMISDHINALVLTQPSGRTLLGRLRWLLTGR